MKILRKLTEGQDLSSGEAEAMMEGMMAGDYTPAQTASLLVALRMKGESDEEIAAFASVMRKHAVRISPKAERLVDTCGTEKIPVEKIEELVKANFRMKPSQLIQDLQLLRPIYRKTAAYGHFGRKEAGFNWELTDKAEALRKAAGVVA